MEPIRAFYFEKRCSRCHSLARKALHIKVEKYNFFITKSHRRKAVRAVAVQHYHART